MAGKGQSAREVLIALLIGAVLGGVLGEVFKRYLPIIGQGASIGFKPVSLDLNILGLTFGFTFKITIAAVIGMLVAFILVARK
ncbi:MAG: DUF4321 domain-containing protein [Actinomycetota bacterium]